MMFYPTINKIYRYLWSKYRPVILKLMIDADHGPQQYALSGHEFKSVNPREKGGYSFTLNIFQGRAVNNIKNSGVAKDLLLVLQESKRGAELIELFAFEIILDKHFVLHVIKKE